MITIKYEVDIFLQQFLNVVQNQQLKPNTYLCEKCTIRIVNENENAKIKAFI